MTVSPEFELATLELEKVNGVVSNDDLLQAYAFYKVAHGAPFDPTATPGTFNFAAKYKFNAWKAKVDEGLSAADAETKYIELVEGEKAKLGYDPKKTTMTNGTAITPEKLKRFDVLSKQLGKNQ